MHEYVIHESSTSTAPMLKRAEFILKRNCKSPTEILQNAATFAHHTYINARNYNSHITAFAKTGWGRMVVGGKCQTVRVCPQAQQLVTKNTPTIGN